MQKLFQRGKEVGESPLVTGSKFVPLHHISDPPKLARHLSPFRVRLLVLVQNFMARRDIVGLLHKTASGGPFEQTDVLVAAKRFDRMIGSICSFAPSNLRRARGSSDFSTRTGRTGLLNVSAESCSGPMLALSCILR
jgi:hypothetical protein